MRDKRGIEIKVGDVVAFTLLKYRGNSPLQVGVITSIEKGLVNIEIENGKKVSKRRNSIVKCSNE